MWRRFSGEGRGESGAGPRSPALGGGEETENLTAGPPCRPGGVLAASRVATLHHTACETALTAAERDLAVPGPLSSSDEERLTTRNKR